MIRAALWLATAAATLAVLLFGDAFAVDVAFRICTLVIVAVSWNLMAGAGLVSLGHSGFWGLGAYAAILSANKLGLGLVTSMLPAILIGALIGAALALITGRLRGIYFAITTLAMSEGFRVLAIMLPDVTNGYHGLYLDSKIGIFGINLLAFAGGVATVLIAWAIGRSRYHYALRAMRNNEAASQMLGVEPMRYRLGIMAISGAMASFGGAVSTWRGGYLDPGVAFDLHTTINSQIAPIMGGIYTLAGPVIGSVATVALGEVTRVFLGDLIGVSLLVFGIVLIVVVLWMPQGMVGAWDQYRRKPAARAPELSRAVP